MTKISKILFLNQMAGPLFRELAEDMSSKMLKKSELFTGHPDTLAKKNFSNKLIVSKGPSYNRGSKFLRVMSWIHYSLLAFWKMIIADNKTIIFIVSNPPFLGFFALLSHFIKRTKYIVLIYDMHVDLMINLGFIENKSLTAKFLRIINRNVWEKSIAVYTIGNFMADNLSKQFNFKKTKLAHIGVVYPWADTDFIKPIPKSTNPLSRKYGQENKLTILYSGNMGMSHDIDSILQASKILAQEKKISFLLIGEGEKWKEAQHFQKTNNLTNLNVIPFQSEDMLPHTMSLADIAIVSLNEGSEKFMVPSKMFYYMSAGAALIGICKEKSDVYDIIHNNNCGLTIEPRSPNELAALIKKLSKDLTKLQNLKYNSRSSALSNFSRKVCTNKFIEEFLLLIK